ncbi:MAG: gliding motility-associated C-terminal domain-containing protein [bacterium]
MLSSISQGQVIDTVCAGDKGIKYAVERSQLSGYSSFLWTVDGGDYEIISAIGDTIEVDWGNTAGEYKIEVVEISSYGCYGPPVTSHVRVAGSPDIELGDEKEICHGEELVFDLGSGFVSYQWHDGSVSQTYIANSSGLVWGEVIGESGCSSRDSVNVTIYTTPMVEIEAIQGLDRVPVEELQLCGDSTVRLDAGQYVFYSWSTGEITRDIDIGEGTKMVWVEVEDENGCISSDTILIYKCNFEELFDDITYAFTPNGDGDNDVWKIKNIEQFADAEIVVYDRWGRLVYKCQGGYDNETVVWDGRDLKGKKLPMDSYYYVIYFTKEKPITGAVTIIR